MNQFMAKKSIPGLLIRGQQKTKAAWMTELNRTSNQFDDMFGAGVFAELQSTVVLSKGYDSTLGHTLVFTRDNNPITSEEADTAIANINGTWPDLNTLFSDLLF